ncbi:MAG: hypothetical protein US69_C0013G0005 [candidate division TM6 bacterium GW2011_GWF2_38_10]|nr:MAG: hypothetical protein US69_C0013G0005 [candidate division TM6 bacterium GW2011_GWF2_38_10]
MSYPFVLFMSIVVHGYAFCAIHTSNLEMKYRFDTIMSYNSPCICFTQEHAKHMQVFISEKADELRKEIDGRFEHDYASLEDFAGIAIDEHMTPLCFGMFQKLIGGLKDQVRPLGDIRFVIRMASMRIQECAVDYFEKQKICFYLWADGTSIAQAEEMTSFFWGIKRVGQTVIIGYYTFLFFLKNPSMIETFFFMLAREIGFMVNDKRPRKLEGSSNPVYADCMADSFAYKTMHSSTISMFGACYPLLVHYVFLLMHKLAYQDEIITVFSPYEFSLFIFTLLPRLDEYFQSCGGLGLLFDVLSNTGVSCLYNFLLSSCSIAIPMISAKMKGEDRKLQLHECLDVFFQKITKLYEQLRSSAYSGGGLQPSVVLSDAGYLVLLMRYDYFLRYKEREALALYS